MLVGGERDGPERSHSCSFDQRRRPGTLRTAMATAFFCPTKTTSRLPRVTQITLQPRVVLDHDRDHDGRILRALALVDGRGVGGHQSVELAKAIGHRTPVEAGGEL